MASRCVIIIPARYRSIRFPGKALASIRGCPMIEHVVRRAEQAKGVDEILVATDDERIQKAVEAFGGKAVMTLPDHPSGTDRIAEVASRLRADLVVNVQGDEPLISPKAIEQVIEPLVLDEDLPMTTLMSRITEEDEMHDPNIVKVVTDRCGYALYFSRSLIPCPWNNLSLPIFKHVGIYGYRRSFLLELSRLKQTTLEKTESLEQLRALENGYRIKVVETEYRSISVDTPEQLEQVERLLGSE